MILSRTEEIRNEGVFLDDVFENVGVVEEFEEDKENV